MITWDTQSEYSSQNKREENSRLSRWIKKFNQMFCSHDVKRLKSRYINEKREFAQHCTICGKRTGPWM